MSEWGRGGVTLGYSISREEQSAIKIGGSLVMWLEWRALGRKNLYTYAPDPPSSTPQSTPTSPPPSPPVPPSLYMTSSSRMFWISASPLMIVSKAFQCLNQHLKVPWQNVPLPIWSLCILVDMQPFVVIIYFYHDNLYQWKSHQFMVGWLNIDMYSLYSSCFLWLCCNQIRKQASKFCLSN